MTMVMRRAMLIAGRWVETGATRPIHNPFNSEGLADVCLAGKAEAEEAIRAAVSAFAVSRKLPAHARSLALQKIAGEMRTRQEEFARCLTSESGKPITDARREVGRAITTFAVAAEEAKRIPGEVIPLDITPGTDHHLAISRRVPIGPILRITPLNFPPNLVAHKVAPALAAGNPIVLKPASQTPISALRLGRIVLEAGWPEEGIAIVPSSTDDAAPLVEDERIKLLTFTGSPAVGWGLKSRVGR